MDPGILFERFFRDKVPHYTPAWAKQAATRRTLFEAAWGKDKRVDSIGQNDLDHFARLRRSGEIHSETSRVRMVRDGTIEADIRWLSTVFRWARGVRIDTRAMFTSNPLEGLKRPEEKNPRRPVASHERYLATLAKVDEVDPKGRLRCMLTLARYTGRRENAICQLRADDILWSEDAVRRELAARGLDENDAKHYPQGGIRWRAESDKMGVFAITPLSGPARKALERCVARNPRLGEVPLFPSPKNPEEPIRVDTAGSWLRRAEKLPGLPPLQGGRWHPYRRLFAIELKSLPVHDVAAAGGWKSTETVQRIYQQPEAKGVLAAVRRIGNGT